MMIAAFLVACVGCTVCIVRGTWNGQMTNVDVDVDVGVGVDVAASSLAL
jgi:hypothetical protein